MMMNEDLRFCSLQQFMSIVDSRTHCALRLLVSVDMAWLLPGHLHRSNKIVNTARITLCGSSRFCTW